MADDESVDLELAAAHARDNLGTLASAVRHLGDVLDRAREAISTPGSVDAALEPIDAELGDVISIALNCRRHVRQFRAARAADAKVIG